MKKGVYVAMALLGGALLAQWLLADPGYVAIRMGGRLFEMSVVVFVLLLIATYVGTRLLLKLLSARRLWQQAQEERRFDRARRSLARGVLEMAEGNWQACEETLVRSVQHAQVPAAHLLMAARAAELQGAEQRRNELLARALEASTDKRAPVLILQAELHLKHGERAAAQVVLEQLDASGEQNTRGLLLLARTYEQAGEWQKLKALEPRLHKLAGAKPSAERAVAGIHVHQLREAKTSAELSSLWKGLPRALHRQPEVVTAYAYAAIALGDHDAAESELVTLLQRQWDEAAVLAMGELATKAPLATLERAEQWLPAHQQSAALTLSCARLAIHAELYGKARSYLEASLGLQPRLETYQLLADLLEQLGERDRALKVCMDAVAHALGGRTRLPRVRMNRWLERRGEARRN